MPRLLTLECGCRLCVTRRDETTQDRRIVVERGTNCLVRSHTVGTRLFLWEILPDLTQRRGRRVADEAIEWS